MKKNTKSLIIGSVLIIAALYFGIANTNTTPLKTGAIATWSGSQPIVLTNPTTGISYDVYLTNTGFTDCINSGNRDVVEV